MVCQEKKKSSTVFKRKNTKEISSTPNYKIHNVWHVVKNDKASKEAEKYEQ